MATDIRPPSKGREKVMLKPGFHLVDWMKLTQVSTDMRGPGPLRKISAAELREHTSQYDCWTAYKGKVYNITQYVAYHPGGAPMIMSGAGRDCTVQFNKFHAWVNAESMLSKCMIGVLMTEEQPILEGDEEDEDEESQVRVMKPQSATIRMSKTVSMGADAADPPEKTDKIQNVNNFQNIQNIQHIQRLSAKLLEDESEEKNNEKHDEKAEYKAEQKNEIRGEQKMGEKGEEKDVKEVKVLEVTNAFEELVVDDSKS